jgi:2-phosphosulfolactate phosphatase
MKIETILTPAELPALAQRDLRATACVVFDVLRATSTFVTALHHGAQAIIPVSEIAEAVALKNSKLKIKNSKSILLGGERNGVRISVGGIDFDLGNSPREFTPEKIRGKVIASTTTNGTRALRACAGAKIILASSFLNLSATANFLRAQATENVLLICAGTGEGAALEDILAAGALANLLTGQNSDATEIARRTFLQAQNNLPAAIASSQNGCRLLSISALQDDVQFCSQRDVFNLVAAMDAKGFLRRI